MPGKVCPDAPSFGVALKSPDFERDMVIKMKYIFLDIDGTLFDHSRNEIPESAYRGVELARKAGHKIFICTGRSCCLLDHVKDIKYDGVIAAAGAYARVGEKVIYEDIMPEEELQPALEYCLSKGASYVMEGKTGVYMHREIQDYFAGRKDGESGREFFRQKTVHGMDAYDPEKEVIYKFCLYAEDEKSLQEIEEHYKDKYQFVCSIPNEEEMHNVEVLSMRNNKAGGIRKIMNYLGGSMEDTVAIGDSLNDLEMIQECGIGIVMGNGDERLKPYADYITADIGDDGLFRALEHYGLTTPGKEWHQTDID